MRRRTHLFKIVTTVVVIEILPCPIGNCLVKRLWAGNVFREALLRQVLPGGGGAKAWMGSQPEG
ncbi:hypothetical protein DP113_31835 [Brasilonema octagenarum UFV-E1]|nr:hypothetical protein DP113_31835 [Brasilonema octagenarum UFV-E1]